MKIFVYRSNKINLNSIIYRMVLIVCCLTNLPSYGSQDVNSILNSSLIDSTSSISQNIDINPYKFPKFGINLGYETSTFFYFGVNYRILDDILLEFDYAPRDMSFIVSGGYYEVFNIGLNWQYNNQSKCLISFHVPYITTMDVSKRISPSISHVWTTSSIKSGHLKFILGISQNLLYDNEKGLKHSGFSANLGVQACVGFGK